LETSVKQQPTVAFYQHVIHKLLKELIELEFTIENPQNSKPMPPLRLEEKNAVRYIAGYVCRRVYDQLKNHLVLEEWK